MILFLTTGFKNTNGSTSTIDPDQKQGTFYADTLFWSGETKEIWLRGKIKIKFGENDLKGDGAFSCFGKVHLLIVDGRKASPNASIVISGKKCIVGTITKKVAMEKYGLEGEFGALEITVVQ
jgi:hypothetical protein